jgi:hypothetical protein
LVTPIVPTPSLHTLQLIGLSISKAYNSLLCNATYSYDHSKKFKQRTPQCCNHADAVGHGA